MVTLRVGLLADAAYGQRTGIGNYVWRLLEEFAHARPEGLRVRQMLPEPRESPVADSLTLSSPLFSRSVYLWYPYVARRMTSADVDILHNPSQVPTYFRPRVPYVLTVHDLVPVLYPGQSRRGRPTVYRLLFRRTVLGADHIITVSESTRQDVLRIYGVPMDRVTVIPLAAAECFAPAGAGAGDERADAEARRALGIMDPYVLYVGTLEVRKNVPLLIEAFARVCAAGLPHRLVLTGKLGWRTEAVKRALAAFPSRDRIVTTGFVPDAQLPALYRGADVFVYPSLYEGFGLPPLEAMACGTPVITTDASSLPEVAGDAAVIVAHGDVERLGDELLRLLHDPELRRRLRAAGLERASSFSWKRCAEDTVRLYRQVFAQSAGAKGRPAPAP